MKGTYSILALVACACTAGAATAPVQDSLILHLNAAGQPGLRQSAGLPPIRNTQPADLVLDGSTNARIAAQTLPERRPIFVSDGVSAYWKFDGKDDFLALEPRRASLSELTVFVLAAPKENVAPFTGLFGAGAFGANDYTSGLNFDFGPQPTKELSVLNVESPGAGGFRDMLTPGFFNATDRPFGDFHVFTVRTKAAKAGTEVFLDGFKGGDRDRGPSNIALDQWVIGGRFYSNEGSQPAYAQGFLNGAIAEVLAYERALTDDERRKVEEALLAKTVGLNALLRGAKGHALETVKDAPVVQMLVPGFAVNELPLKIGNLNNVRYRHDGKLVGQGYDGRIYLLTDTDGDGMEDTTEFFWEQRTLRSPLGIALTPKDDPRGDGVFVASKGKVSFIVDRNRDGRGDEEIVIASGWPEPFHNVDTLGLALDPKDGSIYFGRGCANFVEAYLIDKTTGKSQYRLADERGTIQRISADFKQRETICTGVRYTCALAFNRHGDLFATDQEGATWLPNGNPLDELLHVQRGKHYGFPPRHPKHLPDVRDEPSVYDYGPQHQSTVGLTFNEGINGGPHFGPAHWAGDALVCGESRGKLYRTRLAKTGLGYVAQNHLIASLTMLAVDACVSPTGDLVVACHSGPPDWGTGPAGEGRLFKIRYRNTSAPQPVTAWTSAPDEFRIAFDRPLQASDWANTQKLIKIEAGEHVAAGDRFELIRPGYQIVRDQMAAPRRWVDVLGVSLSEDNRTLVLRVPRQTEPVTYAVTLPLPPSWKTVSGVSQHQQMDLAITLNGISATAHANGQELRAVLPHPSLGACAALMEGSADHERFLAAVSSGATLSLRAAVNVSNPFVPAVQAGARLDWDMAKDAFASKKFSVKTDFSANTSVGSATGGDYRLVNVTNVTNPARDAHGLYVADGDLRHVLSTARVRVPWAIETAGGATNAHLAKTRSDVKGNWIRGRRVFFGDGGCATCHTIRGEGTVFGPDLSNLVFRDRDSVVHDILQPSATINPDHTGSLVTLNDGIEHSGVIRTMNEANVVVGLPAGAQLDLARKDVRSVAPMKISLMPLGISEQLSAVQMEDLLTFLLLEGLEPAPVTRADPPTPPARRIDELTQVLGGTPQPAENTVPLRILLVSGPKDHGPDEHDYPLWLERWSRLLALGEHVLVKTSNRFPASQQLAEADVTVFYNANNGWDSEKAGIMDEYHKRGGGAVYIHYAVDGGKDPAGAAERIGLAFTLGSKFRHGDFDLVFTQPNHPITRGFPTLHFTDETYWNMRGDAARLNVLGTAVEDGAPRPELWTLERGKSRIVACIPGHYTWTFDDPLFRALVFRSICWAAKLDDVDRLAELTLVGARVSRQ